MDIGSDDVHLSIVIPVYNEEKIFAQSLKKIQNYLIQNKISYEIIVVNDGSTDSTGKLLEQFKDVSKIRILNNSYNRGKGFSVRRGVLSAQGKYILFSDADLSVPIEEISKILSWHMQGYEVVIGSRRLAGSAIHGKQPIIRSTARLILNILVKIIFYLGINDTQCGFKSFMKDAAQDIFRRQSVDGYGFDIETLFIAKKCHYKIKEVAIEWIYSSDSKISLYRDAILMFRDILRMKRDFKKNYFNPPRL